MMGAEETNPGGIVSTLAIRDLLEAGVHFGHQTRRWNPKMKKFIFLERNGIYIIDLAKTLACIQRAEKVVREQVAKGGSVIFVGTKPQAKEIIQEEATRSGQHYIIERWLGGTLTNFQTLKRSLRRLDEIESMEASGDIAARSKKEQTQLMKEKAKLAKVLSGIRRLEALPAVLFVVDTKKERIAVAEANRLGIPVIGMVDTNCDPDSSTYPIPANDDAIRSVKLVAQAIADAVLEGTASRSRFGGDEGRGEEGGGERMEMATYTTPDEPEA
jgi:small subunit ribosomal protein S2